MRLFSLITLTLLCCVPLATVRAQKSETNKEDANLVSFTISFTITATPGSKLVKLDVLLPQTIAGRQKIVEIKYSLTPAKKFRRDGNSYAQFVIVKPKKTTEITISVDAEILRYDLSVASANEANRLFEKKKTSRSG